MHSTLAAKAVEDPYNLERFIKAQDQGHAFENVLAAFRGGHQKPKPATWMWFVFPQMNLCQTRSLEVKLYEDEDEEFFYRYGKKNQAIWRAQDKWPKGQALTSLDEARAYLAHPVLGDRLRAAATAVLESPFADNFALMDNISMDVARLHSSMTIFRQATRFPLCIHHNKEHVPGKNKVFAQVINRFFVSFADSDEEEAWLDDHDTRLRLLNSSRNRKDCLPPLPPKLGSRHKPTLQCLERQEKVEMQRRLKQGLGCICGRALETVIEMDKESNRKMDRSEATSKAKRQRKEGKELGQGQKSTADVGKDRERGERERDACEQLADVRSSPGDGEASLIGANSNTESADPTPNTGDEASNEIV